jgi:N-acetylated-alpha-linked acidic dipeptidase
MTSRCGLLRIPTFLVMIIALLAAVPPGGAQSDRAMRGYGDAQTKEQRGWEEKMRAIPDPESLRRHMAFLASGPHHVGSSKDKENAGWILDKFKSWGLPASIEEYRILFPTPRERRVELLAPEKFVARLQEPAVIEDPDSTDADQLPTYNALPRWSMSTTASRRITRR